MPCTAAAAACTVVTHGIPARHGGGADLVAVHPWARVAGCPPGRVQDEVDLAGDDPPHDVAAALAELADDLGGDAVAPQHLRGARRGEDAEAQVDSRLTGKIAARLSRLATHTNTVPLTGSDP